MPKFKKKPVVIEAIQFNPSNPERRGHFGAKTGDMFDVFPVWLDDKGPFLLIQTEEGEMRANPGDWIITGIKGERYPCKSDIFEATYEKVE